MKQNNSYVYIIKNQNEVLYVGKDECSSKNQSRIKQHLKNRDMILHYHSLIDIQLALLDKQDIEIEIIEKDKNVTGFEKKLIKQIKPKFNQIYNPSNQFKCPCQKKYKYRKSFEQHFIQCQGSELPLFQQSD